MVVMDFGKWLLESDSLVVRDDFMKMLHAEAIPQCRQSATALPRHESVGVVFLFCFGLF